MQSGITSKTGLVDRQQHDLSIHAVFMLEALLERQAGAGRLRVCLKALNCCEYARAARRCALQRANNGERETGRAQGEAGRTVTASAR